LSKEEMEHEEIIKEGNRLLELMQQKNKEDVNAPAELRDFLDDLAKNQDFLNVPKNKQNYLRLRSSININAAQTEIASFSKADFTVEEFNEAKASFAFSNQTALGLDKSVELLYEALRLTIPGFEIEKISEYYLTTWERALISSLANVYNLIGEEDRNIDIYKELVKPKGKKEAFGESNYPRYVANLVIFLMNLGRFEEAVKYAAEGVEFCLTTNNTSFLPFLSGLKAYTTGLAYGINEDGTAEEKARAKEVKELYRYAYYYALLANDQDMAYTCYGNFTMWFKENIDGTPIQ